MGFPVPRSKRHGCSVHHDKELDDRSFRTETKKEPSAARHVSVRQIVKPTASNPCAVTVCLSGKIGAIAEGSANQAHLVQPRLDLVYIGIQVMFWITGRNTSPTNKPARQWCGQSFTTRQHPTQMLPNRHEKHGDYTPLVGANKTTPPTRAPCRIQPTNTIGFPALTAVSTP